MLSGATVVVVMVVMVVMVVIVRYHRSMNCGGSKGGGH